MVFLRSIRSYRLADAGRDLGKGVAGCGVGVDEEVSFDGGEEAGVFVAPGCSWKRLPGAGLEVCFRGVGLVIRGIDGSVDFFNVAAVVVADFAGGCRSGRVDGIFGHFHFHLFEGAAEPDVPQDRDHEKQDHENQWTDRLIGRPHTNCEESEEADL